MLKGEVTLATTGLRFLLAGVSWSRLDFLRPGEVRSKSSLVMDQGTTRVSLRCEGCKVVTTYPLPFEESRPEHW